MWGQQGLRNWFLTIYSLVYMIKVLPFTISCTWTVICTRITFSDIRKKQLSFWNHWSAYLWLTIPFTPFDCRFRITTHWTLKRSWATFVNCQCFRGHNRSNNRSWNRFTRFFFSSRHACRSHVSFLSLESNITLRTHRSHDALLSVFVFQFQLSLSTTRQFTK